MRISQHHTDVGTAAVTNTQTNSDTDVNTVSCDVCSADVAVAVRLCVCDGYSANVSDAPTPHNKQQHKERH